jgi:hypothetical protein
MERTTRKNSQLAATEQRRIKEVQVLEPRGTLSLGVPDAEWPLKAYADPANEYWSVCERWQWHPKSCRTQLDHINYHFRPSAVPQSPSHQDQWGKAMVH